MDTHNIVNFCIENNVSEQNQSIVLEYLKDLNRSGMKEATVRNNEHFLRFLLTHTKTDLDKLTKKDVNDIQDAINDWRKKNGKPASPTSKMQYKITFQRFLKGYGASTDNKELIELAKFGFARVEGKKLESEDILSEEEVEKIISCCIGIRDKALVAIIYELGARVGEIQNCKISDVKDHPYGFHITLNGKTGKRQVLLHKYQVYLKQWLVDHPNASDPGAPLFTTAREYTDSSHSKNKKKQAKDETRVHTPLRTISMNLLLKKAAKKAGIKKNVYCHLLRHSQATRLANTMTEQQLKKQMGWAGSSNQAQTYVHLSNPEIDHAVLASYGIRVVQDQEGNKVNRCARCSMPIPSGMRYCDCGMPVTQEAAQDKEMLISDLLTYLQQDPTLLAKVSSKIK